MACVEAAPRIWRRRFVARARRVRRSRNVCRCSWTAAISSRGRRRRTSHSAGPSFGSSTSSATSPPHSEITSSIGVRTRCAHACAMRGTRSSAPTCDMPTARDVPWIRDDTLIVRNGLKVGVIGLASVLTATHHRDEEPHRPDLPAARPDRRQSRAPVARERRGLRDRARPRRRVLRSDRCGGVPRRDRRHRAVLPRADRSHRQRAHPFARGRDHRRRSRSCRRTTAAQRSTSSISVPDATTHAVRNVLTDSIAPDPAVAAVVREEVARVAPIVGRRVATIAEHARRGTSRSIRSGT